MLVTTWGSRGDFQPYLALARGFRRAGHDVRLAGPDVSIFADAAAEQDIPYIPAGGEFDPNETARFLDSILRGHDPIRQARKIIEAYVVPSLETAYVATLDHARWSDIVVSHFFQPAGRMVAEATDRPWVSGSLAPMLPTSAYPPPLVPNLGRLVNRVAWWIAAEYVNRQWTPPINRVRARMGLPPFRDLYRRDFFSPYLDLVGVSRYVAGRPLDWPRQTHITGYWFLERPDWSPPTTLAAFLAAGPKPIAIGFGSMATEDRAGLTRMVVEAVGRTGERAVLQSGWAELGGGDLPPSICLAGDVPHDWL
ncbi:MAG: glycosyltransferase, partial [Chloroflexota bacterium]|nr:glycosyltransferase [Chloroflexota bacterium]